MCRSPHSVTCPAEPGGSASGVAAIVLNYNGWRDTVACLLSLLRSVPVPDTIIIVDNASTDDSACRILHAMKDTETDGAVWEMTASTPDAVQASFTEYAASCEKSRLFFIQSRKNGGYAAGNNLGIRLAMLLEADALWILNNDTVVSPNALHAMKERLFSRPRPGLCGACIRYMEPPDVVQCLGGGHCSRWTGLSTLFGNTLPVDDAMRISPEKVEAQINFIYGASVMASRTFIETVGLMDERFFMYCEEQDWAYRAAGKFDMAYAANAHIWHKEGASTGWPKRSANAAAIRRLVRSRLLLTRKHYPEALPTVVLALGYAMFRLICRKLFARFT